MLTHDVKSSSKRRTALAKGAEFVPASRRESGRPNAAEREQMEQLTQEGAPARLAAAARTRSGDLDAPARPRRSVHADGDRWRLDIQGLRGVAILAVVIYHADPTLLPGGFIGVDLFFVISGFLITGLLMRELEERGTVSLRRFYARRIRRLLPM